MDATNWINCVQQHTGSSVDTEAEVEGSGTQLSAAGEGDAPESPDDIEDNQQSEDHVEPPQKR